MGSKIVVVQFSGSPEMEPYVGARHIEAGQGKLIGFAGLWMYGHNHYAIAVKGEARRSPYGARAMLPELDELLGQIIRGK